MNESGNVAWETHKKKPRKKNRRREMRKKKKKVWRLQRCASWWKSERVFRSNISSKLPVIAGVLGASGKELLAWICRRRPSDPWISCDIPFVFSGVWSFFYTCVVYRERSEEAHFHEPSWGLRRVFTKWAFWTGRA